MLLRVEESWLLEGFLVGKSKTSVSHLQFADDAIFFLQLVQKINKILS